MNCRKPEEIKEKMAKVKAQSFRYLFPIKSTNDNRLGLSEILKEFQKETPQGQGSK